MNAAQFGAKKDEKGELIKDEKGNPTFVPDLNPFAKGDHTKVAPNEKIIQQQSKTTTNEASARREVDESGIKKKLTDIEGEHKLNTKVRGTVLPINYRERPKTDKRGSLTNKSGDDGRY